MNKQTGLIWIFCLAAIQLGASELSTHTIASKQVGKEVTYNVLVADGLEDISAPLLLWLHGGGGDHKMLSRGQKGFDAAWKAGKAPPMIVVTPNAERSFYLNYQDGSENWESFIMDELLSRLIKNYHIDESQIFIGGISMGGMGSARMALKYPNKFRALVCLEPGIPPALAWDDVALVDRFWRSDELLGERFGNPIDKKHWARNNPATIVNASAEKIRKSDLQIYLEVGSEDLFGLNRGTEFLHQQFYQQKIPHEYRYILGADHVGNTMPARIAYALEFLNRVATVQETDKKVQQTRRWINRVRRRAGLPPLD